jgi:hypothetical protein
VSRCKKFYPKGRRGSYQEPLSSFHLPEPEKGRGHIAGGKSGERVKREEHRLSLQELNVMVKAILLELQCPVV